LDAESLPLRHDRSGTDTKQANVTWQYLSAFLNMTIQSGTVVVLVHNWVPDRRASFLLERRKRSRQFMICIDLFLWHGKCFVK